MISPLAFLIISLVLFAASIVVQIVTAIKYNIPIGKINCAVTFILAAALILGYFFVWGVE